MFNRTPIPIRHIKPDSCTQQMTQDRFILYDLPEFTYYSVKYSYKNINKHENEKLHTPQPQPAGIRSLRNDAMIVYQ